LVSASVDPIEKAKEVSTEVSFSVGYGVTRSDAHMLGSFWEERRSIIQPSEFILNPDGKVIFSSYSDGPLARLEPADLIQWIKRKESKK
jgi:hypothetical protein